MTTPRTVADYGAPKETAVPLADAQKYVSGAEYCRLVADLSQLTCTSVKAWVHFPTVTSNGAVTPSAGGSHMGVGVLDRPAVARTATGTYTVTYPSSFTDSSGTLGNVGATEAITFTDASGGVIGSTFGHVQASASGAVITVYVFSSSHVLSDLGGGVTIRVEGR